MQAERVAHARAVGELRAQLEMETAAMQGKPNPSPNPSLTLNPSLSPTLTLTLTLTRGAHPRAAGNSRFARGGTGGRCVPAGGGTRCAAYKES